eukprot:Nk52_evm75s62 gene=Nk52_evmTU75s62
MMKKLGKIDLKLDLKNVEKNAHAYEEGEKNEKRKRIEQLAYYESVVSKVCDHVYLGSALVSRNMKKLQKYGITHIVNCSCLTNEDTFRDHFKYLSLPVEDVPTADVESFFGDIISLCEEARAEGGRVLFHCQYGVSRSAIMVLCYLMWLKNMTFEESFEYLKKCRPICNPNYGFICQLAEWDNQCKNPVHSVFVVERYTEGDNRLLVARKKRCEYHEIGPLFDKFQGDYFIVRTPTDIYAWEKEGARQNYIVVGENAVQNLKKTCRTYQGFKVNFLRGGEGRKALKNILNGS